MRAVLGWSWGKRLFALAPVLIASMILPALPGVAEPLPLAEVGRFYVTNFAPRDDYPQGHPQNWSLTQDEQGYIYVGNSDGVLIYDGVAWRLIEVTNATGVRAVAVAAAGRVYVGAQNELGYLASDERGSLSYVSLLSQLPEDARAFADIWRVYATAEGVYFQSHGFLFLWCEGSFKIWRPPEPERYFYSHLVRGTVYIQAFEGALWYLHEEELKPLEGSEIFAGRRIYSLLPFGEDAVLAVTREHGLFSCYGGAPEGLDCSPWLPEQTEFFAELRPYRATLLPDGGVAIGTLGGGLILLDSQGRLRRVLTEADGLRRQTILATFVDRQEGLWLGLDDGLARVEILSPVSYFDGSSKLKSAILDVARHRDRLYVATFQGLRRLLSDEDLGVPEFERVPGIEGPCWSLLSTQQGLLAGCAEGVYDVEAGRVLKPFPGRQVLKILRSNRDPDVLYLGLTEGLARLELEPGGWHDGGEIDSLEARIRSIVEDRDGRLWMGTPADGVLRLDISAETDVAVHRFGEAEGLPLGFSYARSVAGEARILFKNGAGLFRLDPASGTFVPDTTFDALLPPGSRDIHDLVEDAEGRVWIAAGAGAGVALPREGGGYDLRPSVLRRVREVDTYVLHAEADGTLWVGGSQELVRLAPGAELTAEAIYPAWIRSVLSAGGELRFGGHHPSATMPVWPYNDNAVRFVFAAPRYDAPEHTEYRTRLDGFEDEWSDWSREVDRDFTNLWEGRYAFRVQARDVYGLLSQEDRFAFQIEPPKHRTWWALTGYILLVLGAVWAGTRWRTRSLTRRNAQLTREIEARRDAELALHHRNRELARKNAELERYAYTVSHDLKNPVVTIKNFLGLLRQDAGRGDSERLEHDIDVIALAADKLGVLLEDLLKFNRGARGVDSVERVSLEAIAEAAARRLKASLDAKGVTLDIAPDLPTVRCDRKRLIQVFEELMGNAIKFMGDPEGPRCEIGARSEGSEVVCWVRDNGVGIDSDYHGKVFELFDQLNPESEGSGLGLALVEQIIEAHGGRVWVESSGVGHGSSFYFTLPRNKPSTH